MKRLMGILLAAMLLMTGIVSAAGAESSYIDLQARDLIINRNSEVLACRFENSKYYCLIRPDGTKITPEQYTSAYAVSDYPFFEVEAESRDGIHDEGIIDEEGHVIVPVQYADVMAVSDRWAYGVKLVPSNSDDKDYTFTNYSTNEKTFYRIDTVDFYYRGTLAGTLNRSDFEGYPNAYGDYLCVQTREKVRKYYNSKMEPAELENKDSYGEYTSSYQNRKTTYIHNGSGQVAFDPACTLTADEVAESIRYEKGKFIDLQGNEPFKAAQNYDYVSFKKNGYAIVNMNSKKGLIDSQGKELIPVEYDDLSYVDNPLEFGVISAEQGGKFGFLDAAGNVTCGFTYPKDIVRDYGPLATVQNLDGTTIVLSGAVGELPEHYTEVDMSYYSRAFVAKNANGECSLIDMTGETLIPYVDAWGIYFNRAATVAYYSMGSREYRIYTFTHDDAAPAPAAPTENNETDAGDGTWTCSNGHTGNSGNFCPVCGEPKPAEDVTCPACDTVYPADEVPNFCPQDGTKLK